MDSSKPKVELTPNKVLKPKEEKPRAVIQQTDEPVTQAPKAVLQGFNGSNKADLFPGMKHEDVIKKMQSNRYFNHRKENINATTDIRKSEYQRLQSNKDDAEDAFYDSGAKGNLDDDKAYRDADEEMQEFTNGDQLERYTGTVPYGHNYDRSNDWGEVMGYADFKSEGNETILDYSDIGSRHINAFLRTGELPWHEGFERDEVEEGMRLWAYEMMHRIDERRELERELDAIDDEIEPDRYRELFRGVPESFFDELVEGDIIRDPGFLSTSADRSTARNFGSEIMRIKSFAPGYEVHPYWDTMLDGDPTEPEGWHEREFIMHPNTPLLYKGFIDGVHEFEDPEHMVDENERYNQPLQENKARVKQASKKIATRYADSYFEVLSKDSRKKFTDFVGDHDD